MRELQSWRPPGILLLWLCTLAGACGQPEVQSLEVEPGTIPYQEAWDGSARGDELGVTQASQLASVVSESGLITLSVDGVGTNGVAGTLQVHKPAGATVRSAFLAAASTGLSRRRLLNGDVRLDGQVVNWSLAVQSNVASWNHWANVTALVKSKLDTAPAGPVSITVTEANTTSIEGEILAVIFDDPRASFGTIILLFGTQQKGGGTLDIAFAEPVNKTDVSLAFDMSLGISFGYQGGKEEETQYSTIDVNGLRLTSMAGGQDDGEASNGTLLTVGGTGDTKANPEPSQRGPGPRGDDELYDLLPFIKNGDSQAHVFLNNPSNNDNIFFGALRLGSAAAIVGEGLVLRPMSGRGSVGQQYAVTAFLQDAQGQPLANREVTFRVLSGPNAGLTGQALTDAAGHARYTYTGSGGVGEDRLQASYLNSTGQKAYSSVSSVTWEASNRSPVASCRGLSLEAGATCGASGSVDNGSYDPDGDLTGCTQSPAGPYGPGATNVTLTCTDQSGRSSSCTARVVVADRTAPTLTCPPNQVAECVNGAATVDTGQASAGDNCGAASVSSPAPARYELGSATVTHTAVDTSGNAAQCTSTVTVRDTRAPTLTPNGALQPLECGVDEYLEPGASAADECHGALSSQVSRSGSVNTRQPGSYEIAYTVTDPSGHTTTTHRTVTVRDTRVPSISLNGGNTLTVLCGKDSYSEAGASATDLCSGNVSASLVRSGSVNTRVPGTYTLSYSATDAAGKVATATRLVRVIEGPDGCYQPTWTRTGSLLHERGLHAAVRLLDGRVLTAGGWVSTTELYEPASGTWRASSNLTVTRRYFTLTLLADGRVLAAGGGRGRADTSAELYSPGAGTWRSTGSMAVARQNHTATLLADGKVLVAGGASGAEGASAELYDPNTGTWRRTGYMAVARSLHTATLLADGKVLVAGGVNPAGTLLASAEIYDPATGAWRSVGGMSAARRYHTATLLPGGKVLLAGGASSQRASAAELYDPTRGTWAPTGSMVQPRRYHTATPLPSGRVLVVGGYDEMTGIHTSAELYDPTSGTWRPLPAMHEERYRHIAALLANGQLLVAGGLSNGDQASSELFDSGGF